HRARVRRPVAPRRRLAVGPFSGRRRMGLAERGVTQMPPISPIPEGGPPRRILGVDPGLNITGYAVVEAGARGPVVLEAGIVRGAEGRSTADMARRLRNLYDGIVEILDLYHPGVLVVEQLYAHYDHPRTAILMAHARGAILLAGAQRDLPVHSYNAT